MQYVTVRAVRDSTCSTWQYVQYLTVRAVLDSTCRTWQYVQYLTVRAELDRTCRTWQYVQYLTEHEVLDSTCSTWQYVQNLTKHAIPQITMYSLSPVHIYCLQCMVGPVWFLQKILGCVLFSSHARTCYCLLSTPSNWVWVLHVQVVSLNDVSSRCD